MAGSRSTPHIANWLGTMMPESHPGELYARAETITSGTNMDVFREKAAILTFHLSNKMACRDSDWGDIVSTMTTCGLMDVPLPVTFRGDATISALGECIFSEAIKRVPWPDCEADAIRVVKWLLDSGLEIDHAISDYHSLRRCTPLAYAIADHCQSIKLVELLLDHGANVKQTFSGNTALEQLISVRMFRHRTVTEKKREDERIYGITKLLVSRGAEVNPQCDRLCRRNELGPPAAIHRACRRGDITLVKFLVEKGANVLLKCANNCPFSLPGGNDQLLSERTLITEALTRLGPYGSTDTDHDYQAEMAQQGKMLKYLLQALQDRGQRTPISEHISPDSFIAAATAGNIEAIRILHSVYPQGISKHNAYGVTALHALACRPRSMWKGDKEYEDTIDTEICHFLIEQGASPDSMERGCPSPLHVASYHKAAAMVEALIQHGANLHAPWDPGSLYGMRPPDIACVMSGGRRYENIRLGKSYQMSPTRPLEEGLQDFDGVWGTNREDSPWTKARARCPMLLVEAGALLQGFEVTRAIEIGDLGLLRAILDAGGDPNEENQSGERVLQMALKYDWHGMKDDCHVMLVGTLLKAGAEVRKEELTIAMSYCNSEIRGFILDAGICDGLRLQDPVHKYDTGVLCGAVLRASQEPNSSLAFLLGILEKRKTGSPTTTLENTAIGIAALHHNLQLTKLLLSYLSPVESVAAIFPIEPDEFTIWCASREYKDLDAQLRDHHTRGIRDIYRQKYRFWDNQMIENMKYPLLTAVVAESSASKAPEKDTEAIFAVLLRHGFVIDQTALWMMACCRPKLLDVMLAEDSNFVRVSSGPRSEKGAPLMATMGQRGEGRRPDKPSTEELARTLIDKGWVDINGLDRCRIYGRSPLQAAVETGSLEIMDILIDAGANVNGKPAFFGGATALQLAAICGRIGVVRRLIELKANVNAPRAAKRGRTALEGAAEHGRLDTVAFLLKCETPAMTEGAGRGQFIRAVQFANKNGHSVVAKLLKAHRKWTKLDEEMMAKDLISIDTVLTDELQGSDNESEDGDEDDDDTKLLPPFQRQHYNPDPDLLATKTRDSNTKQECHISTSGDHPENCTPTDREHTEPESAYGRGDAGALEKSETGEIIGLSSDGFEDVDILDWIHEVIPGSRLGKRSRHWDLTDMRLGGHCGCRG